MKESSDLRLVRERDSKKWVWWWFINFIYLWVCENLYGTLIGCNCNLLLLLWDFGGQQMGLRPKRDRTGMPH